METIKCIETRRSIRRFNQQNVPKDVLIKIIESTRYAPSWKNTQTARYIAIYDADLKTKIANECVLGHQNNKNVILSAPVLIVQTAIKARSGYERDGSFTTSKGTHWQSYDAGISAQTFCLVAHEYGLSTLIMGIFNEDKVANAIKLDNSFSISSLIALGYTNDISTTPPRKSVEDILTFI